MNEDELLEQLFKERFGHLERCPKCNKRVTYHRLRRRKVYAASCGHQISILAGTIYEKSTTPLIIWFTARKLIAAGATTKALQRNLGVSYKTAWRMKRQITQSQSNLQRP